MSLANLFRVKYPSGLIEHVRDDAKDVEAFVMKCSGMLLAEAKAFGLEVEHLKGVEESSIPLPPGITPIPVGEGGSPPPAVTELKPVPDAVPLGAMTPELVSLTTSERSANSEARFKAAMSKP